MLAQADRMSTEELTAQHAVCSIGMRVELWDGRPVDIEVIGSKPLASWELNEILKVVSPEVKTLSRMETIGGFVQHESFYRSRLCHSEGVPTFLFLHNIADKQTRSCLHNASSFINKYSCISLLPSQRFGSLKSLQSWSPKTKIMCLQASSSVA